MNRIASESALDRLIALAENGRNDSPKPAGALPETAGDPGNGNMDAMPLLPDPARGMDDNPMLKALLQFRMMAPYMSRLMDSGSQDPGLASIATELKQSVGDLQLAQRDLRMTVQEQLVQMKRVEEEMHRTREATERNASEASELVYDMKAMHSLLKKAAAGVGVVLVSLIGLAVYLVVEITRLH